jgi:putative flippase GtrA
MSIHKRKAGLFLRFCTVGVGNTAVDLTTFFLLTQFGSPYLLAQMISYTAGVVNSFVFNRKWTFRMEQKTDVWEVMKFASVNGLSLLVSSSLLFLLHDGENLNLWISKCMASGCAIIVNFMGSRYWVFTDKQKTRGEVV